MQHAENSSNMKDKTKQKSCLKSYHHQHHGEGLSRHSWLHSTHTHIHTLFFLLWKPAFFTYSLMERKSVNLEWSHLFQCRSVTSLTICITVYYESNNSQVRWAIPLPSKYLVSWIKLTKSTISSTQEIYQKHRTIWETLIFEKSWSQQC